MPDDYLTERGRREAEAMFGPGGADFMEQHNREWADRIDPDWARIINGYLFEGLYSRGVLPTATRELCVVAALTVLGRTDELDAHLRVAVRTNPLEQVREVLLQMSVYGGMPVALHALRRLDAIVDELPPEGSR